MEGCLWYEVQTNKGLSDHRWSQCQLSTYQQQAWSSGRHICLVDERTENVKLKIEIIILCYFVNKTQLDFVDFFLWKAWLCCHTKDNHSGTFSTCQTCQELWWFAVSQCLISAILLSFKRLSDTDFNILVLN